MHFDYIVENEYNNLPLLKILKNKFSFSTRLISKLKSHRKILNNGQLIRVIDLVHTGDKIFIDLNFDEATEFITPENIPLKIIYEDDALIAIDKKPGMVVHPSANHPNGTIANALLFYFNKNSIKTMIRPVSRLDRDTSGVILFAKNSFVQENLIRQMSAKTFTKEYIGVISGSFEIPSGTIDLPIARKYGSTILREVNPLGARSITHYKTIFYDKNFSLIKFNLETGRTHQIRVHCQSLNHPLVGDTLYNSMDDSMGNTPPASHDNSFFDLMISRQALHARKIHFIHPITSKKIIIKSPIPKDILTIISNMDTSRKYFNICKNLSD